MRQLLILGAGLVVAAGIVAGCRRPSNEVVLYCSVDQAHAEPILRGFHERTGVKIKTVYDSEAVKTVGLINRLRAEKNRPRADVFWSGEFAGAFQLYREHVLEEPALFAARVRVLVYNTNLVQTFEAPKSILDLKLPRWKGQVAMAYPMFGATATHAAALFAVWGPAKAEQYYRDLLDNQVKVFEGNSVACEQVAQGHCKIGITDTDDYWERKSRGAPLEIVYPDQGGGPALTPASVVPGAFHGAPGVMVQPSAGADTNGGQLGCFVIPSSVAIVRGGPNLGHAETLRKELLSRQIEEKLAFGPSHHIPYLWEGNPVPLGVRRLSELRAMKIDPAKVAEAYPQAMAVMGKLFAR